MAQISNVSNATPSSVPLVDPATGLISVAWMKWFQGVGQVVNSIPTNTPSVTIATAKLTGGGAAGSQTFVNGVLTASTPAT